MLTVSAHGEKVPLRPCLSWLPDRPIMGAAERRRRHGLEPPYTKRPKLRLSFLLPGSAKGVFWKRGLFKKVRFLQILEILEILENPQNVEKQRRI